ncbi:CRTAC1 family protein [uncultured Aquimarina sp.]|uniref:CRTAC1 family protein n=1 Tax=uncultured Aquimarina sp. TaxID=575652 RepID=UPI0026341DE7|nr:CRTAC1 family protein [uncultured Aquimarina sp.]
MKCNYFVISIFFVNIFTISCVAQSKNSINVSNNELTFSENDNIISLENRNRRKFDNAVIADLDQDGFLDLLLTEHSRRVELYWNNKGIFEKGDSFISGDTHGIAVADYNLDGVIDILVQPGGGDGKNPRKLKRYQVYPNREIKYIGQFEHFDGSRGRAVKFVDVDKDGKLDLITSSFPSIKGLDKGNIIYNSDDELTFKFNQYLPHADRISMRTSLLDFNNDNITDIIFHGGQKMILVKGLENGGFVEVTKEVFSNISDINLVNSISQIDIDNDGDNDLFLTRSKLPFASESEYDSPTKTFYFFARRNDFNFEEIEVKGDLVIENLQMAHPHFDIFLGAKKKLWKRTNDRHGHHDLILKPEDGIGFPESTEDNGLYIGYIGNNRWRISGYTDSPTSAVLHNVETAPKLITQKKLPAKLLENKDGRFFDVTSDYGINIKEQTTSTAVGDFNNDGWSDIFVLRYGNPAKKNKHILLLNRKGKSFESIEKHGLITEELGATGMGADAFDYDNDGDLDIVCANERGKWHLFTNDYNSKSDKHVIVNVGYSPSKKVTAMGAVLTINACGNVYKRIVGETSSSYSHSFNTQLHVGLGTCEKIESATVLWSNGEQENVFIDRLNTKYTIGKNTIN